LTPTDSLDRTGRLVAIGVFVALVVDGIDLQMLALALPSISNQPNRLNQGSERADVSEGKTALL
jgi:hypothetical protein